MTNPWIFIGLIALVCAGTCVLCIYNTIHTINEMKELVKDSKEDIRVIREELINSNKKVKKYDT